MGFYRWCVRPVLFRFDPEYIHHRAVVAAGALGRNRLAREVMRVLYGFEDAKLHTTVAGIDFSNPVGLPGGFDKNGLAVECLAAAGFGFLEVGSVSLHPSAGNPERPRLFRLPADESMMVYYGVPNDGVDAVARRLARVQLSAPLGINVVETNTGRISKPEEVIAELAQAVRPFLGIVDYIVVCMNCPNSTDGVSVLDEPGNLQRLLESFSHNEALPPMFLKIRVPLEPQRIDAVLQVTEPFAFVKGFIPGWCATTPYSELRTPREHVERMRGTMTGPHSREGDNAVMRAWFSRIEPSRYALIGSGGIFSAEDAYERIRLGASLVQVYTALVYKGPGLVKQIKKRLSELLERDGFGNIAEAVGIDHVRASGKASRAAEAARPILLR